MSADYFDEEQADEDTQVQRAGLLPPQDLHAEQSALGSMLIERQAALLLLRELLPTDFYHEAHQAVFRAMVFISGRGEPVDLVTVSSELRRSGDAEKAGGVEYLTALINSVPTAAHVLRYSGIILEKSRLRQIITTTARLQEEAYREAVTPEDCVAAFLPLHASSRRGAGDIATLASEHLDWLEVFLNENPRPELPLVGIPTLDKFLGGLGRQQVVIIKAETGFGKTTLMKQSCLETARALKARGEAAQVLYYSLEGTLSGWQTGAVAYLGNVSRSWLRHGAMFETQMSMSVYEQTRQQEAWQAIVAGEAELSALPLVLREFSGSRKVQDIVSDALYYQARGPRICAVYVDYLQRVQAPGREITEKVMGASSSLLDLSARLGAPVIAGAQVTRKDTGEKTTAWASAAENDASLILQLDRGDPKMKNPDEARRSGVARIKNTKAREDMPCREIELDFQGQYARFAEREAPHD